MSICRRVIIVTCGLTWLLLIGAMPTAWAQQTGTLAGTVRDAQGAVCPARRSRSPVPH